MPCTIQEIWDKLNEFYGMEALDELVYINRHAHDCTYIMTQAEEDDEQEERSEDARHVSFQEFSLPLEDYDQLISEHRQDNRSEREESPSSPPTKRTRTSRRERSPTNSANESTPEPDEGINEKLTRAIFAQLLINHRQTFKKERYEEIRSDTGTTDRTSFSQYVWQPWQQKDSTVIRFQQRARQ